MAGWSGGVVRRCGVEAGGAVRQGACQPRILRQRRDTSHAVLLPPTCYQSPAAPQQARLEESHRPLVGPEDGVVDEGERARHRHAKLDHRGAACGRPASVGGRVFTSCERQGGDVRSRLAVAPGARLRPALGSVRQLARPGRLRCTRRSGRRLPAGTRTVPRPRAGGEMRSPSRYTCRPVAGRRAHSRPACKRSRTRRRGCPVAWRPALPASEAALAAPAKEAQLHAVLCVREHMEEAGGAPCRRWRR